MQSLIPSLCTALWLLATALPAAAQQPSEAATRLLDVPAFDRITLTPESGGEEVDVQPLELSAQAAAGPFPASGSLKVFRLSEPSVEYLVSWTSIATIERYPDLLLAEAQRLTQQAEWGEAFEHLAYLQKYYPDHPGLDAASQNYLWRDAGATFSAGKPAEALPVLMALYERNPAYPRLANAVQVIGDALIARLLKEAKFAAARSTLSSLEQSFPDLALSNLAKWNLRFAEDARRQVEIARKALAQGDFGAARTAAQHALAILPTAAGAQQLLITIQRAAPEIRVGVTSLHAPNPTGDLPTWERTRVAGLRQPQVTSMIDFGAEGGVYRSPWGTIQTSDSGLQTTITFRSDAIGAGVAPESVALVLLRRADPNSGEFDPDFAALLEAVELAEGNEVLITWSRPHISPVALLRAPLAARLEGNAMTTEVAFEIEPSDAGRPSGEADANASVRYRRGSSESLDRDAPRFLVELEFRDDEEALAALGRGEIDLLSRIPPWQVARAKQLPGVRVEAYRLPTIHALAMHPDHDLLEIREFRRALCYGIDRPGIVRDMLLAGQDQPGFQPLSGPFSAGVSLGDPVGYAYDTALAPRTYEPRLAAVLAGVARAALAKRAEAAAVARQGAAAAVVSAEPRAGEDASDQEASQPPVVPLVLAHGRDPVARLACQTIKLQLEGIGVPIKLLEVGDSDEAPAFDLAYVELAIWEPIVDARPLLGPGGSAGSSSAFMNLALNELTASRNWNEARNRLKEIHRIARSDLPLIPLWQTLNHFAYREGITGIGPRPVTLYQNLDAWRKGFGNGQ